MMGERIRVARKSKGITQEELGKLAGISGVAIMRYEKEQREPKQRAIYLIAEALDVNEAWLMGYDVEMERPEGNIRKDIDFTNYLRSIGYDIKFETEVIEWHHEDMLNDGEIIGKASVSNKETFTSIISRDNNTVNLSENEYKSFKDNIKNAVEYELFKLKNK